MKNTGGAVLSALDATCNYLQRSYEPMPPAGQTVPIRFTDKEDPAKATSSLLGDVAPTAAH